MAKLTAAKRKGVSKARMGVPSKATKSGGAVSGTYPMPDRSHAANALARASGKPVAGQVRAKAEKLYPGITKGSKKGRGK